MLLRRGLRTAVASRAVYNNILETIGRTPIVRINKLAPPGVTVYAKVEYFNPLSSVKDRLAIAVIEDAERQGLLKPGQTIVEATSGNTGIALAMVCAAKGYPLVITMAETFSVERRRIMRFLGARVIVTPAASRGTGMVKKAEELAKAHGWFRVSQFSNEANPAYHANTTGPEILLDFVGKRLDYFVLGYGTGGTFAGAGRTLKAARPDLKIVLAEPANAPLLNSGKPQSREASDPTVADKSHPAFTPHPIQGWTPDFIPLIVERGMDAKTADSLITVTGDESIATSQQLAQKEGIFTGISGGGAMAAALKVAATAPKGSVILTLLADTAERYLSTPLFQAIPADMNPEEQRLSQSTPNFQMPPPPPPPAQK